MKRVKIINEVYDNVSHVSSTTILTPLGKFTGEARLHPNDPYPSPLAGTTYSYGRALIAYNNARIAQYAAQAKTLETVMERCAAMRNYNPKSAESHMMRVEVKVIKKRITNLREHNKRIKDQCAAYVERRLAGMKEINYQQS